MGCLTGNGTGLTELLLQQGHDLIQFDEAVFTVAPAPVLHLAFVQAALADHDAVRDADLVLPDGMPLVA